MSKEHIRINSVLKLLKQYPTQSLSEFKATVGVEGMDDCAIIPISDKNDLIIGSDFVRGTGFTLFKENILSLQDIGYYLVGANASDLAAMGATPIGIVIVIRYTKETQDSEFEDIMEGVVKACQDFNIPLLGGDTGGYKSTVLSASAFGICAKGQALLRRNGCDGDKLFLTGTVGDAGAALAYYSRAVPKGVRIEKVYEDSLSQSWKKLDPALRQGQLLVKEKLSKCAIDTSDGLKAACRQIAEASHVNIVLNSESIPITKATKEVARVLSVNHQTLAMSDSVDFRLLFSCPNELCNELRVKFKENDFQLFEIGELRETKNTPDVFYENEGQLFPVIGIEWDQSEELSIDKITKMKTMK